ncbi:MAG: outer membrane protein assembly factor BamD [Alphaproteobacteria bacterium]|nr:outer membrane protein assembly factor BamD [Alphaproteobacteria bacterium]
MSKRLLKVCIFLSAFILTACSNKFKDAVKSKDYDFKLKIADFYFDKKNYENAQILYEECFPHLKGSPKYEIFYYKFAMSYYLDKDYLNAENIIKNFINIFPESALVEEAEFIKALCYYKQSPKSELDQTNTYKAISALKSFIYSHPESKRADSAQHLIDQCNLKLEDKEILNAFTYYNLGFFKSAAIAFNTVNEEFPDSKKSDYSKYHVILSHYKYAHNSLPEFQQVRFKKVVEECLDFELRYGDSKYIAEVNDIKNKSLKIKIKNYE